MTNTRDWVGAEVAKGRYTILGLIGSGSMGQVFRALDRNLGIDVAIKFPETPARPSSAAPSRTASGPATAPSP